MGEGQQNVSPTVSSLSAQDEKNSEKPLDKPHKVWYNKNVKGR